MTARIAKDRLLWIVQADRLRCMQDGHLRRRYMVWWVPTGFGGLIRTISQPAEEAP